jgi:hypothetical protein
MKKSFSISAIAVSNMAVVIIFILIFLTGSLMAQNATLSRDYWHPNKSQRAVFVKFSDSLNANSALAELKRLQLEPANLDDLMAYHVSTYVAAPANKIVALGSKWDGLTGYDYIPYSDADEKQFIRLKYDEFMWDTSFVFMAFREKDDKFSFGTLEHYFKYTVPISDDDTASNELFVNKKCNVMMFQKYHASLDVSSQTWMNAFVLWHITYKGQIIRIPNTLSYQSILSPKVIMDNLVFKAVDRGGEHGFYTVVPLREGKYMGDAYHVMPN